MRKLIFLFTLLILSLGINVVLSEVDGAVVDQLPYSFAGIVYDENHESMQSISVTLVHLRTGQELTNRTNSKGAYVIDLSNLNERYQNGDEISISVTIDEGIYTIFGSVDLDDEDSGQEGMDIDIAVIQAEASQPSINYVVLGMAILLLSVTIIILIKKY